MSVIIPSALVEFILLGPFDDRRQVQDSPILGDVWVEFGREPVKPRQLLIAPFEDYPAGKVAANIHKDVLEDVDEKHDDPNISYLQGMVVASLTFSQVLRFVVPRTKWWIDKWSDQEHGERHTMQDFTEPNSVAEVISKILDQAGRWHRHDESQSLVDLRPLARFVALSALILWAREAKQTDQDSAEPGKAQKRKRTGDQITYILDNYDPKAMEESLIRVIGPLLTRPKQGGTVFQVSLNRKAMPAIARSIPAVKADAARTLFKVNCSEISWAIIDSGIDSAHAAFLNEEGAMKRAEGSEEAALADGHTYSRVKRTFDFTNLRKIVNLSNLDKAYQEKNAADLLAGNRLRNPPENAEADLETLARDAESGRPIHWEMVERFVEIKPGQPPATNHGTHVAGTLGANKKGARPRKGAQPGKQAKPSQEQADFEDGMCPDIALYDFRVLGEEILETEFAIIAALQFIRDLNNRGNRPAIHGVNLSLSIPHDVRNFACGRTPICDECERLVNNGVVVVAAAGNHGYKSFETDEGSFESYAAFSITDPGNADGVITVGATHRFWPHTYGVSFFSSRGPTGDGRLKPDLVAPGERIRAPIRRNDRGESAWGALDGTSMAAPHVSGAAAMLMARYSELIRQPRRIKQILCDSATDLGRERSFQGHGMLDVLRAFQSI